jgi:predicted secreted hydrolase
MMKRVIWIGMLILVVIFIAWAVENFAFRSDGTITANLLENTTTPAGFARADGSHTWNFPSDYGPHPDYQTEWWYYTGNLQTLDGRRFGYQLTFFRRGLTSPENVEERDSLWATNQVYMGHFAISDITAQEHHGFERFSRGAAGLAGAQSEPFQVWLENWKVDELGMGQWRLEAEQDGVEIDLVLTDGKGVILQGEDGYSQKGPETGNASYYFSQPRLISEGVLEINGDEFQVSGLSWMDHEFSTSALSSGQVGWDWFSLQLEDGTDLMIFQIRREDGSIDPFSSGTLITPEGEAIRLKQDDFYIQTGNTWRSPHSGATYPVDWEVNIPKHDLSLEIQPYMYDQEMNVSYIYWEGAVSVRGKYLGQDVIGSGYVEMTGYSSSIEGRF